MKKTQAIKKIALILPVIMGILFFWVVILSYVERGEVELNLIGIGGVLLVLGNIQYMLSASQRI
ncbi:hypothetical protein [Fibrisoma limi]|uniref:hypothetical protein n=1 Tax=Fibrisoma limi TaxID=663275 RepID=UPI00030F2BA2|nr:hypothetical protein [Fibrisoma limi]